MANKTMEDKTAHQEVKQPLLHLQSTSTTDIELSALQRAIAQAFQSTAHLAKLLPAGTVLASQILTPLFTNNGSCNDANRLMTVGLVLLCAFSCFFLCFTDSFRDGAWKVRYGLATVNGLWVIDDTAQLPPVEAATYRIRFVDLAHAFMSVLLFAAVALLDRNTVSCFDPVPSENMEQVLMVLPVGIGVLGSAFFVSFPTTRHGIGFPLSTR